MRWLLYEALEKEGWKRTKNRLSRGHYVITVVAQRTTPWRFTLTIKHAKGYDTLRWDASYGSSSAAEAVNILIAAQTEIHRLNDDLRLMLADQRHH